MTSHPSILRTGWSRLASSADLAPGQHLGVRAFGEDLLLFRSETGALHLIERHCPHLGADLAHGGRVDGDSVICPFHGWRLGGDGQLLEVPYSDRKPPRICVRTWRVREQDGEILAEPRDAEPVVEHPPLPPFPTGWFCLGFTWELRRPRTGTWCGRRLRVSRAGVEADDGECHVVEQQDAVFLWHDERGRPPQWALPVPETTGWTRYAGHCWPSLRSHPQETTENSVDVAHFSRVHGYSDVQTLSEAQMEGPELRAAYAFTRRPLPLWWGPPIRVEFDVLVVGLGYSLVEARVPRLGLHTRQLVLATPLDGERIALRVAGAVRRPAGWLTRWSLMRGYVQDVTADLGIWETKRYLARPRPVSGDGPIGPYRRWVRQFYGEYPNRA